MNMPASVEDRHDNRMSTLEVMRRANFIRVKEQFILKFDLSGLDDIAEVKRVVSYFRCLVERVPPKSMVGLVDFTGLKVTDEVVQEMIQLAERCNPYFRASAVLVDDPATINLAKAIVKHFGKINLPLYDDENKAKMWLCTQ